MLGYKTRVISKCFECLLFDWYPPLRLSLLVNPVTWESLPHNFPKPWVLVTTSWGPAQLSRFSLGSFLEKKWVPDVDSGRPPGKFWVWGSMKVSRASQRSLFCSSEVGCCNANAYPLPTEGLICWILLGQMPKRQSQWLSLPVSWRLLVSSSSPGPPLRVVTKGDVCEHCILELKETG